MKTRSYQPVQKSSTLFAVALVCGLAVLPAFAQAGEDEPPKKSRLRQEGGPRMVLPDSLTTEVALFNRRQKNDSRAGLEFPPYRVSHLKRGLSWDEMWTWFDATVEAPTDPQSFSFTLSEDETEIWQVACRWTYPPADPSNDWLTDILDHALTARPITSIDCRLVPAGSDQHGSLEIGASRLAESVEPQSRLRLTDGKLVYEVSRSYGERHKKVLFVESVDASLAGYLFTLDQEPIAAVTTNPGDQGLIFRNSVAPKDRALIAAAACALLLLPEN